MAFRTVSFAHAEVCAMTVGKDAVERTTHPPYRRKLPVPKGQVFLMGVGAGVGSALIFGFGYFLLNAVLAPSADQQPAPDRPFPVMASMLPTDERQGGHPAVQEPIPADPGLARPEATVPIPTSTLPNVIKSSTATARVELFREVKSPTSTLATVPRVTWPDDTESSTTSTLASKDEPSPGERQWLDYGFLEGDEGPPAPDITVVEGKIQPNQFMSHMLTAAGLSGAEASRTIRALIPHFNPTKSRPGDRYRIDLLGNGNLGRFEYQPAPDEVYYIARNLEGDLVGHRLNVELTREVVEVAGRIEHSLWVAFEDSGESPALAADLTEAFRFDIDFFHETRKGDTFRFFVEKYSHEGELVRYGQIYAAEYTGAEGSPIGSKRLYWYRHPKARTRGFYDETGRAAQRAFLRSPLKFTRISSGFGFRRHPILGRRHFHGGIDYAAPTGTPVRAVAAGTVVAAGMAGPNGNMVRIRHSGGYESFYLHLSRILVKKHARVSQSTIIGKVGQTGRSTGPHLDFRIKKNGKYLNPTKNVAPRTKRIPSREKSEFRAQIAPWVKRLTTHRPDREASKSAIATRTSAEDN